jgi:hypothetical protein
MISVSTAKSRWNGEPYKFRHMLLLMAILLSVANGCSVGQPRPNRSEFVLSTGAGFLMTPDRGVTYGMAFELRRLMDRPVYVVAEFENPEQGSPPLRTDMMVEAGKLEFLVKSPRLIVLKNNTRYSVSLNLYWDEAHRQQFAKHRQEVLFSVPPDEIWRIEKGYGIHVL